MRSPTIRTKLTLWFGVAFVLAGVGLLAVNYVLVNREIGRPPDETIRERLENLGVDVNHLVEEGGIAELQADPPGGVPEVFALFVEQVREDTLRTLFVQGALAIGVIGVLAVAVGWWLSGRTLRPVAEITATARALSEDDLTARVNLTGPNDELKVLADTFDALLVRLDKAFVQYRNFAAVASHELRTPLTVMRIEADNMLDDPQASPEHRETARRIQQAVDQSESMIEKLLALTKSRSGVRSDEPVDLASLVGDVVAEIAAEGFEVRLDLDLGDAAVSGDEVLLRVLVSNVVRNAVLHNLPKGWANVTVATEGVWARLDVSNSGRAYSSEDVETMLEPFERVAAERVPGSGLGLPTSVAIVEAHGGRLTASAPAQGGLELSVLLPSVAPVDTPGA